MKNLLLTFFILFTLNNAFAQDKSDLAIKAINTTEFMVEFDSTTQEIKEYVSTIKQNAEIYNEYELDEIRKAYTKTASEYNSILIRVYSEMLKRL